MPLLPPRLRCKLRSVGSIGKQILHGMTVFVLWDDTVVSSHGKKFEWFEVHY